MADLVDVDNIQELTRSREAITRAGLSHSAAKLIPRGAVVFSSRVVVGKVGIAANELATNQDFSSFIPMVFLDPEFLAYFLVKVKHDLRFDQRGATIKGVTTRVLDSLEIPEARLGRHRAVVQTAAASALGRMVVRLGQRFSIPTINVVRRAEQVELLRKMGAEHVLISSDPGFDASLGDLCHRLGASIGFDAVAGEMSARVLRAQPSGSRLLVYGALSLEASQIDPASLIFEGKRVEGFWLTTWLRQRNMLSQLRLARHVQQMLAGDLKTDIQARLPLKEIARGLEQYASNMTGGKILLLPLTRETE